MIKNITPLLIVDGRKEFDRLESLFTSGTARDPDATAWSCVGLVDLPTGRPIFVGADGSIVFNVQIRERVLPGKVIRLKTQERADEIAERQGRKCGRKEMAEIKERIVNELLPHSHVKPTDILCIVKGNYLLIGTSSAKVVDTVVELLMSQISFSINHPWNKRSPTQWMTNLLLEGSTDSGMFNAGSSVSLRGAEKKTARFKDMEVCTDEAVRESVTAGMSPVELAVTYNDEVMFRLTDKFILKGVGFSDILIEQAREDAEAGEGDIAVLKFDADVAITAGTIKKALDSLLIEIPKQDEGDEL